MVEFLAETRVFGVQKKAYSRSIFETAESSAGDCASGKSSFVFAPLNPKTAIIVVPAKAGISRRN